MKSLINKRLAELAGLHAGDGTLYKTKNTIVWELRGNLLERSFYDYHIIPLVNELFELSIRGKYRSGGKNGCYGIQTTQKSITNTLISLGFVIGKKSLTVTVPKIILQNTKYHPDFLRGLFAADGTAYLARINKNNKPTYPMIEFASSSLKLRNQSAQMLLDMKINSYSWTYTSKRDNTITHYLRITGRTRCQLFIDKIGLINPRHRQRLEGIISFKSNSGVPDLDDAEIA